LHASVRAHSHEPLSALDQETREELHAELEKVHQKMQICTILVSHDLREIFRLSDKVFKIYNGKIAAQGTPAEVFGAKLYPSFL
jgi:molybdate transport system ATP-binding protein